MVLSVPPVVAPPPRDEELTELQKQMLQHGLTVAAKHQKLFELLG